MVRFFLIIAFCSIYFFTLGQTKDTLINDEWLVMYVENPPLYKGDLKTFIQQQINYPETAKIDSIEGKVYICFWVDTIGNTVEHKVVKGIREDVNNEALRITKLIKFEKPAMQQGNPVRVSYTIPVVFKLKNDSENHKTEKLRSTLQKRKFLKEN